MSVVATEISVLYSLDIQFLSLSNTQHDIWLTDIFETPMISDLWEREGEVRNFARSLENR